MYCPKCGKQTADDALFCSACGSPLARPDTASAPNTGLATPVAAPNYQHEQGRGTLILVLGILSLFLLGPILGIPAWIMGSGDLKKIREGRIPISEKGQTKAGMILGIIGTF